MFHCCWRSFARSLIHFSCFGSRSPYLVWMSSWYLSASSVFALLSLIMKYCIEPSIQTDCKTHGAGLIQTFAIFISHCKRLPEHRAPHLFVVHSIMHCPFICYFLIYYFTYCCLFVIFKYIILIHGASALRIAIFLQRQLYRLFENQ